MNLSTARGLLLLAALLALLAPACGGDDEDDGNAANNAANNNAGDTGDDAAEDGSNNSAGDADDADGAANNSADDTGGEDVAPDAPVEYVLDDTPLPAEPWSVHMAGFYHVGFQTLDVTYTPEGYTETRTITLSIWYPTRALSGPKASYSGLVMREGVWEGAPPALTGPRPTLVFSMGHTGFAEQSYFLTEHFASHGWIAVAPTHTGNTIFDVSTPRPPEMFEWRPKDISASIDALLDLPDGHPLAGLVDVDRLALSGHSYGGYTTLAVAGAAYDVDDILLDCGRLDDDDCSYVQSSEARLRAGFGDPRFKAFIPMAPGNFAAFEEGVGAVQAPVLLMTGLLDRSLADERQGTPIWEALTTPDAVRIQLLTGGHHTFSNTCELLPAIGMNDGCGPDFIPWMEAHAVINAAALAFLRWHLLGDESDRAMFMTGARVHPQAEVTTK